MSIIAGIDPGNKGAIAFLDPENATLEILDMPTFEYATTRNRVKTDPYGISYAISQFDISDAFVEEVNSSPQMGVVSAFSFGESKGMILGVLAALQVPTTPTKPTQWKKAMRVPADKRATVQRASQLFPAIAHLFKGPRGGIIDGRAEATLIALYGAIELGRSPTSPVTLPETFIGTTTVR